MDNDRVVWIRTDGNEEMASGHLVRCLTIAKALIKHGGKAHFLLSDEKSLEELRKRLDRDGERLQKEWTDSFNLQW